MSLLLAEYFRDDCWWEELDEYNKDNEEKLEKRRHILAEKKKSIQQAAAEHIEDIPWKNIKIYDEDYMFLAGINSLPFAHEGIIISYDSESRIFMVDYYKGHNNTLDSSFCLHKTKREELENTWLDTDEKILNKLLDPYPTLCVIFATSDAVNTLNKILSNNKGKRLTFTNAQK